MEKCTASKINVFVFCVEIQDGHQKWQEKDMWEKLADDCANTLGGQTFWGKSLLGKVVS